MTRKFAVCIALGFCSALPSWAQPAPPSVEAYFTGKMVTAKMDMPGSEKGVDLDFASNAPMNYKTYNSRLTDFGVSIHRGDSVQITKVVLKKDHIEFQLNGGGYGTFGESTDTKVNPKSVDKSAYEKDLEKQLKDNKDPKQRQQLQENLDREVGRRQRAEADARATAAVETQQKEAELLQRRIHGGSRFNLNFKNAIPDDDKNPDAIMRLLADYIDFAVAPGPPMNAAVTPDRQPLSGAAPAAAVGQLQRGMKLGDVNSLLGRGDVVSQSTTAEGLQMQVDEYRTTDSVVDVTFVEGVLVKYTISSK